MRKNHEIIKKVIEDCKYKILEADEEHLVLRYQLSTIHIRMSTEDDHFVSIMLPKFVEVTEENFEDVVMRCHRLNERMKQVKLYTIENVIIAASEFYYQGKKDLAFQMKIGMESVIAAKVKYNKMDK